MVFELPPYYLNSEESPLTDKVVITDNIELAKNIHKFVQVTCFYINIEMVKNIKNIMVDVHNIIKIFERNCKEYYLAVNKQNIFDFLPFLCLEIKILEINQPASEGVLEAAKNFSKRGRPSKNKKEGKIEIDKLF